MARQEPEIAIVLAEPAHLADIVALVNAGAAGARVGRESGDLADYEPAFEAVRKADHVDLYVALEPDGTVVGTYQISFTPGLTFQGRPRAELESVHTRADRRGRGIGSKMMHHALDLARSKNACLVQLTSNKVRENAHRFYEYLGFEQSHLGFKYMFS